MQEKILDLGWSVLPYQQYSADLATSDFHLFQSLQNALNNQKKKKFPRRSGENGLLNLT